MSSSSLSWLGALSSVVALTLVSLIGILTLSIREDRLERVIFMLVSLAVGAMFGDAFIHLLPGAFEKTGSSLTSSLCVLAGIFTFFLLEKFLLWRHEHLPKEHAAIHPVGYMNLVADGVHNFIDGVLIGASYLAGLPVGLATTVAVLLHEIPQEMGDFGILVHAGFSKSKALRLNFLLSALSIAGAVLALAVGARVQDFTAAVLPLAAGGFIYIAGSDLVPELHKERQPAKSAVQLAAIGVGIGLMLLLTLLE